MAKGLNYKSGKEQMHYTVGQKSNDYLFYDVNTLTLNTQQTVVVWVYPPQKNGALEIFGR